MKANIQSMESQSHQVPSWATCNPFTVNEKSAYKMQVIVKGKWKETAPSYTTVIDPLNGDKFLQIPNSDEAEIMEFVESSKQCPKSGMHNMFKKPERYMMWGDLFFKIAAEMRKPEVELYFAQLIQRVTISPGFLQRALDTVRRLRQLFCGGLAWFDNKLADCCQVCAAPGWWWMSPFV